jgi:hypothetical protein
VAVKVWEAIKGMSVSSEDRVPPVPDRIGDEECVDLFLWLRYANRLNIQRPPMSNCLTCAVVTR